MTAIVFNCAYNGLSIIQTLGRKGVDVHALDSFRNIGTTSRYATYHNCPNPTTDEEDFIEFLINFAGKFDDNPVLIPANDHWASAIANHRDRLSEHFRPCVADADTVDLLLDKRAFGSWAKARPYPVPQTWEGDDVTDIPDDAFPIAAKPGDARDVPDMMFRSKIVSIWNRLTGDTSSTPPEDQKELRRKTQLYEKFRLEVFSDREELNEFVESYPELVEEFAFQEYVRGMSDSMYTVGVYAYKGTVKGVFTGQKVRGYPPDIGDCKVGQVESVPDHLVETSKSACDDLGYTGIAEFEYKRDAETGEFYLIEINPRSWSWVGITPACGVNLPWMAYTDMKGTDDVVSSEVDVPDASVTWVKATEDLLNVLLFYRWSYPEWANGPIEWRRSLDGDDIVYAEGSLTDPLPVFYAMLLVFRRLVNSV
jgi:predicted ATP-grasp superfamily ATP-dependent carboligase